MLVPSSSFSWKLGSEGRGLLWSSRTALCVTVKESSLQRVTEQQSREGLARVRATAWLDPQSPVLGEKWKFFVIPHRESYVIVPDILSMDTWEERTLTEELPPSDWSQASP